MLCWIKFDMKRRFLTSVDGYDVHSYREVLIIVDRVAKEVKAEMDRQGRSDDFVGVKVLPTRY